MEQDDKKYEEKLDARRYFLKDSIRKEIDFSDTDQSKGVVAPPVEKPYSSDSELINLPLLDWNEKYDHNIINAIKDRRSFREYKNEPLTLDELSFLLWATQGAKFASGPNVFRNVPSAGCRHALETYLAVFNVEGLKKGIYRYLPLTHQLLFEFSEKDLKQKIIKAVFNQNFAGNGALTFIWVAIPYRMEWRYGLAAHKVIALDAGHIGQNLYLACEVIKSGVCAIAAYDQEYLDDLLKIDGNDEFAIYLASVGKK